MSDIRHQIKDIRHQSSDIRQQTSDIRHNVVGIVTFDLLVYFPPITLSYYNDIPEFIMFDFNKIVEMESPNFERKEVKAQE